MYQGNPRDAKTASSFTQDWQNSHDLGVAEHYDNMLERKGINSNSTKVKHDVECFSI